ncbi:MAG: hypothetical protein O7J95_08950 [Planctomycetota bacterium]|nr:hypothetical protein [Planctomycetota bacterium]
MNEGPPHDAAEKSRLVVGNLDCEVDFARQAAARRRQSDEEAPPPDDPRFALPGHVMRGISAAATLLRVFAGSDEDVLWTPEPVDPARLAGVPELPAPRLASGSLEEVPAAARILAWGETRAVADLRRSRAGEPGRRAPAPPDGGVGDLLWAAPASSAPGARQGNDRAFCLAAAEAAGEALPGARLLRDVADLEGHLEAGGAAEAPEERWVLKAPYSAAGRSRLLGRGRRLDEPALRRAERLFALHGDLLFEPWMERLEDFAWSFLVTENDATLLGGHLQSVDGAGRFRGVTVVAAGVTAGTPPLDEALVERRDRALGSVGDRLRATGYRGPCTVDAFRYRDRAGREDVQILGEINARLSFGLVARAFVERLRGPCGIDEGTPVTLRLGKSEPSAGVRIISLLDSAADDPTAAWLELATARMPER